MLLFILAKGYKTDKNKLRQNIYKTENTTASACALLTTPSVAENLELALCQGITYLIFRDRKVKRVTEIEPRICQSGAEET